MKKEKKNNKNKNPIKNKTDIWQKINVISSFILIIMSVITPIFCGGFEFYYTLPVCLILLLCAFINIYVNKESTQSKFIYIGGFFVLLACLFLTVFSSNVYLSLGGIILFASGVFTAIASSNIFKEKKCIVLFAASLVFIAGCISIYIFRKCAIDSGGGSIFWEQLSTGKLERIFGTFLNPNFYGGYLAMCFPVSLGLCFIFKEKKYTIISIIFSIFLLINLCLTGSKFSFISVFLGLIAMLIGLIITKSINKQTIKAFLIIGITCIIVFCIFCQTLIFRVENAGGEQVHSTEFRIATWKSSLNIIAHNPIIGVFPGRFSEVFPQYAVAGITKHAHSSYLQFVSEYGILISLIILLGLFIIFKNCFKIKNISSIPILINTEKINIDNSKLSFLYCGLLGGFIAELCHNLVDSDLFIGSHVFIFALICGVFLSFSETVAVPKFFRNTFQNLVIIYILGTIWLGTSVALYQKGNYQQSYYTFPNNYLAIREISRHNHSLEEYWVIKAKNVAPKDYYSYQFIGDRLFHDYENPLVLSSYEKALSLHPHSTLIMSNIIKWAEINHRDDLIEKYNKKIIDQENSTYEKLKGVPEIVDTSYCKAHEYFGNKALKENNKTEAIKHFTKAKEKYEQWINTENKNFFFVLLLNEQNTTQDFLEKSHNYEKICIILENLENKSYKDNIEIFNNKCNNIINEYNNIINNQY